MIADAAFSALVDRVAELEERLKRYEIHAGIREPDPPPKPEKPYVSPLRRGSED
jgi:hypothetical protein